MWLGLPSSFRSSKRRERGDWKHRLEGYPSDCCKWCRHRGHRSALLLLKMRAVGELTIEIRIMRWDCGPCLMTAWYRLLTSEDLMKSPRSFLSAVSLFLILF